MSEQKQRITEIDLMAEQLISFSQAVKFFPSYRIGRPVGASCVWRWFRHGVRSGKDIVVRLEAVRVAGRNLTSFEAVRRFIEAQQIKMPPTASRTTVSRTARSETKRTSDSQLALQKLQ